jgi:CheY-like chemotaxis protein
VLFRSPINQEVAALMLDHLGYEPHVVANGVEALAALDTGSFHLVLMDCQMPEMDGFTAAGRIRARGDARASIPIVAMTANAMKGDREKCLAAGMDDYIAKPIDPKELAATIAKWIEVGGRIHAAAEAAAPTSTSASAEPVAEDDPAQRVLDGHFV